MGETALQRDLSDVLLRFSTSQCFADLFEARTAQITHRRSSPEIMKMLDQRAARYPARRYDFRQSDFGIEILLDVIDRALDVARRDRPFEPPQSFAVVVGMIDQQRVGQEIAV